jgi:hypothetical protein
VQQREQNKTTVEKLIDIYKEYGYIETVVIVSVYLSIGYIINPQDICILDSKVSFILIVITVITLFHGIENGILAVFIFAFFMWMFYKHFPYLDFLQILLMTMIYGSFYYYWTRKIKNAEVEANYKAVKLNELSRAFYTLKISHDQLEKNYVIKPMSIRNSIEALLSDREIKRLNLKQKTEKYYMKFLELLEKSYNIQQSLIIYKLNDQEEHDEDLSIKNSSVLFSTKSSIYNKKDLFKDYLIEKSLHRNISVYVSDENGEPSAEHRENSKFIASLPVKINDKTIALLVIENMPFMSFNRENLTSIAILLEYIVIEIRKNDLLRMHNDLKLDMDKEYLFEYRRMSYIYNKYRTNSVNTVLRIQNALQAKRMYEKITMMLRSLDLATFNEVEGVFYITILFPLHDKSAAIGFINRLRNTLNDEQDKDFKYMIFDMKETALQNDYYFELREDKKNVNA